VTDKIMALFERDEAPAKVRQYAGSALSCLPDEQQAEVEAARAASAARVPASSRRPSRKKRKRTSSVNRQSSAAAFAS